MERYRYQRLLVAGVIVLALLIIELVPRVSQVTSPLQYLGGWIGRAFYVTTDTMKNGLALAVFGQNGATIIKEQSEQIKLLAVDKEIFSRVQAENAALKEALTFIEDWEHETVMARVIGHDPNDPQTRLRINAGTSHGITIGSAVATPAGVMVGVVVDTQERLSTIQLLKNPSLTIPVRLSAQSDTFGLLQSPDGFSLHITQVPKDSRLEAGDIVMTNAGFREVPSDLSIGVIGSVREDPESLWQQAQVVPYVDTRSLDYLLVIKTP